MYIKHITISPDYCWNSYIHYREDYKKNENKVYLTLSAAKELINHLNYETFVSESCIESYKGFIIFYKIYIK